MSRRTNPAARLLTLAAGDVLAARACARDLLLGSYATAPDPLTLLALTAACLEVHARCRGEMTSASLLGQLRALAPGGPSHEAMVRSPQLFTRYVAAELADADPDVARTTLAAAHHALHSFQIDPGAADG